MAQANVNSTDLIQVLKSIQQGIHSVESTHNMIKSKYYQLGSDWNDKKWKELGDVLQECCNALNELQTILIQTEKYIMSLSKHIQEYEATNLGANNHPRVSGMGRIIANHFIPMTQTVHRKTIASREGKVDGVIDDIKKGSGKIITAEQAVKMLDSIDRYSSDESSAIRYAYNNSAAPSSLRNKMEQIDAYIHNAPKWKGVIFRGINISRSTAQRLINQGSVDMLGPSSWSSNESIAQRFSIGAESINMVFVLRENHSAASITHIARYNGNEEEVLAPSGVRYEIDNVRETTINGQEYVYVDVHEESLG